MHIMLYLKQIINLERALFRADHLSLMVAFILLVTVGYAIVNGQSWVDKQQQGIDIAQTEESVRLQGLQDNLSKIEAGSLAPGRGYQNPANAYWVGNRHAATYAVLPPMALAATAVGQSDLNPSYVRVTADNKDSFALNEEIENPSNLLIGNFDLAFVAVFLLPLLIIALSYNLLSAEREQGTLAITMTNPVPLWILVTGKLCFRICLVFTLMASITVVGLIAIGTDLTALDNLVQISWWLALLFVYIVFWYALAVAVNVLAKSSAQNALMLMGLWITLVLVLPTLLNIGINVAYSVPSRVEMVGLIRAVQSDASKGYDAVDVHFQQEHPEMAAKLASGDDDYAASLKRVLLQQAAAERVSQVMAGYDQQLAQQQYIADKLRFLSPAIVMQEALNTVAGTDNSRYQHLSQQVDAFHREWQGFFLPKVFDDTPLTLADYSDFPRFNYVEQPNAERTVRLFSGLLGLVIPISLLYFFSIRRIRNYPVTI